MKSSHLRTPRLLADCQFIIGDDVVEPAMWRGRWNKTTPNEFQLPQLNWVAIVATVAFISIAVMIVAPNL